MRASSHAMNGASEALTINTDGSLKTNVPAVPLSVVEELSLGENMLSSRANVGNSNEEMSAQGQSSASMVQCSNDEQEVERKSQPSLDDTESFKAMNGGDQNFDLPDWSESIIAVEIPPRECKSGGKVEHVVASRQGLVSEIVAEQLRMPLWLAQKLLTFGSIFTSPVPPQIPEAVLAKMSMARIDHFQEHRRKARAAAGNHPGVDIPRRCLADYVIEKNSYMRVHCEPKRFPAAYTYDWKERVIFESEKYVVVNKPPCVPAAPVVDNILESVPAFTGQALNYGGPLLITSRLDHCTEGLLVLAKDVGFAALYNHLQTCMTPEGQPCVRKHYRAVSLNPPPTGVLVHYLKINQKPVQGGPLCSLVHPDDSQGAKRSELVVHNVREVQLCGEAAEKWGSKGYESWIELKTGRTHQIRAQLAACGAPLCGDILYESLSRRATSHDPVDEQLKAPRHAVGLQCAQLECYNLDHKGNWAVAHKIEDAAFSNFTAGTPWWRRP